jgi:hypothetical protein
MVFQWDNEPHLSLFVTECYVIVMTRGTVRTEEPSYTFMDGVISASAAACGSFRQLMGTVLMRLSAASSI